MANIQDIVNHLAKLLRIQIIEALIKEDCFKFNAPLPSEEELDYRKVAINKLPCCTKMLKKLFQDAHDMQEARGMFPRPVCVADLEWCLNHRNIGLLQRGVRQDWLPAKEDNDLQQLPAFVQLDAIYRKLKKALPPIDEIAIQNEATAIINNLTISLSKESA